MCRQLTLSALTDIQKSLASNKKEAGKPIVCAEMTAVPQENELLRQKRPNFRMK